MLLLLYQLLYQLLWVLLLPLVLLRMCLRGRKSPAYRQCLAERFGIFAPAKQATPIWIHGVSVGETVAAAPLVAAIRAEFPHLGIIFTTTTPTGSKQAVKLFGKQVFHVYAPYDLTWAVQQFLSRAQPKIAIVMETELWPVGIALCHRRQVPFVLVNGRLSARSAAGYRRFQPFTGNMLRQLHLIVSQTQDHAQRFRALGAKADAIHVSGNIKFDQAIVPAQMQAGLQLRQQLGQKRPIWIAASTHEGEEEILLTIHQALLAQCSGLMLVLVPRHPERFEKVAQLVASKNLTLARRSLADPVTEQTEVYLGDTMGEMMLMYKSADIAFVGGSLVNIGGHNPLEPAALAMPVICGPYSHNFAEIIGLLKNKGGLKVVETADELQQTLAALLNSATKSQRMGQAALEVVTENKGALERLMQQLRPLLTSITVNNNSLN